MAQGQWQMQPAWRYAEAQSAAKGGPGQASGTATCAATAPPAATSGHTHVVTEIVKERDSCNNTRRSQVNETCIFRDSVRLSIFLPPDDTR